MDGPTCGFVPVAALGQAVTGVGFAAIEVHDPVNGGNMPGYVFYPSARATGVSWRGPYELDATENAPPIPGARPLVMISHGHGGSDLGHHDLATLISRAAASSWATITHPKDNFRDSSGDGHPAVLVGRPVQISGCDLLFCCRVPGGAAHRSESHRRRRILQRGLYLIAAGRRRAAIYQPPRPPL